MLNQSKILLLIEDETDGSLSSSDEYIAASAKAPTSYGHDSEPVYVNFNDVRYRGRPVSLEPTIAENSDEDYPQEPVPAPPTNNHRVLHAPVQAADMSLAAAAAAPHPIQESCSRRMAVEHVDMSSELRRLSSRGPRVAPKPQINISEVTRQFV